MDTYNRLEDTATHIDSDIRAIRLLLEDLHMEPDPYRIYAVIILTEHLQGLGKMLDGIVSEIMEDCIT